MSTVELSLRIKKRMYPLLHRIKNTLNESKLCAVYRSFSNTPFLFVIGLTWCSLCVSCCW